MTMIKQTLTLAFVLTIMSTVSMAKSTEKVWGDAGVGTLIDPAIDCSLRPLMSFGGYCDSIELVYSVDELDSCYESAVDGEKKTCWITRTITKSASAITDIVEMDNPGTGSRDVVFACSSGAGIIWDWVGTSEPFTSTGDSIFAIRFSTADGTATDGTELIIDGCFITQTRNGLAIAHTEITTGVAAECVDLYDDVGVPQTTGSPDGDCDFDGSTALVAGVGGTSLAIWDEHSTGAYFATGTPDRYVILRPGKITQEVRRVTAESGTCAPTCYGVVTDSPVWKSSPEAGDAFTIVESGKMEMFSYQRNVSGADAVGARHSLKFFDSKMYNPSFGLSSTGLTLNPLGNTTLEVINSDITARIAVDAKAECAAGGCDGLVHSFTDSRIASGPLVDRSIKVDGDSTLAMNGGIISRGGIQDSDDAGASDRTHTFDNVLIKDYEGDFSQFLYTTSDSNWRFTNIQLLNVPIIGGTTGYFIRTQGGATAGDIYFQGLSLDCTMPRYPLFSSDTTLGTATSRFFLDVDSPTECTTKLNLSQANVDTALSGGGGNFYMRWGTEAMSVLAGGSPVDITGIEKDSQKLHVGQLRRFVSNGGNLNTADEGCAATGGWCEAAEVPLGTSSTCATAHASSTVFFGYCGSLR